MKAWAREPRGSSTALLGKDKTTGIPPGADLEDALPRG